MTTGQGRSLTNQVVRAIDADDERFAAVVTSLVKHLHAFVLDVEPTAAEWQAGMAFLERTGGFSTPDRHEFILLADMLGLTSLVDDVNQHGPAGMTPSSVEGPFHSPAPPRELGAIIAEGAEWERAERAVVHGRVEDCHGTPLPGATIDLWQADDRGRYDTQDDAQPKGNLRGLFTTDADGRYWFRTVKPSPYPVPVDGPGGELLGAMGRHPMRPGHLHIRVEAAGYQPLTTHVFVAGDPYLESDAAFAVKDELVVDFVATEDPELIERYQMSGPFLDVDFTIRLATLAEAERAR